MLHSFPLGCDWSGNQSEHVAFFFLSFSCFSSHRLQFFFFLFQLSSTSRSFRNQTLGPRRSPGPLCWRRRTLPRCRPPREPRCRACTPSSWPGPWCRRAAELGPTCWTGSARPRRPEWRRSGRRLCPFLFYFFFNRDTQKKWDFN